jgi:tryptophan-rich sensory protein
LSIGDIWNTINNKERRYGTSVVGVFLVWASAATAAYQYYQAGPSLAGRLLSLPLIWLTIASSLILRTWQLNPSPATGKPESLLPTKTTTTSVTKLEWFEK